MLRLKKLKINPPRRRESARVKRRRSASVASTPTTATSGTSAGDTIEVAQKSSDGPVEHAEEVAAENSEENAATSENPPTHADDMPEPMTVESMQPAAEKIDVEMEDADVDDSVTEFDFNNEKDSPMEDDTEKTRPGFFKDTINEVITISSDDEGTEAKIEETFPIEERPWLYDRKGDRASLHRREIRERMYALTRIYPFGGDWETTELYQEQMDIEMEKYVHDFPIERWVIGIAEAQAAFERMMIRKRMRGFGVPIFQQQHLAEMGMQPTHAPQMPASHQHRGSGHLGHHQMPMPQQHPGLQQHSVPQQHPAQHHMPPPHMIHQGGMPYGPPPPPMPPHMVLTSNQPMQYVGNDQNGQPLYQPVPLQQHQHASIPAPPIQTHHGDPPPAHPSERRRSAKGAGSPIEVSQPQVSLSHQRSLFAILLMICSKRKYNRRHTAPIVAHADAAVDPSIIPPYEVRDKPGDSRSRLSKGSRRRMAEPTVYPWNRKLDFVAEKTKATWTRSIYTQETLITMEKVRAKNAKYFQRKENEEMRMSANGPKQPDVVEGNEKSKRPKRESKAADVGENLADHYASGHFNFASEGDRHRAGAAAKTASLPKWEDPTVEGLMEAAEMGQIELRWLGGVNICWNSDKKGITQELDQVTFSIRDTLKTRAQLSSTPILTTQAAECIIDFCPDLLWRDMLLRITSETQFRNKEVHDRMCLNGNYMDKATITKRIGAALGQKQDSAKKRASDAGEEGQTEENYYEENVQDYQNYQLFFGKGPSQRKNRTGQSSRRVKRNGTEDIDLSAADSRPGSSRSDESVVEAAKENKGKDIEGVQKTGKGRKRATAKAKGKAKAVTMSEEEVVQVDGAADDDDEEEVDIVSGAWRKAFDEVSEQSDGYLDRLEPSEDGHAKA